ncbi:hypothetical protein JNUCC83_03060 [Vagococcus sp. JNUCC 83]
MENDYRELSKTLNKQVALKLVQDKLIKQGKKITINCASLEEAEDIYIELVQKQAMRYMDGFGQYSY